jgi:uncharacterized protein YbaA (DUF1428 family)
MAYFEGFIAAVPSANREAYRQHAAEAAKVLHEFGVTRHVEAWGHDLPEGKTTDFRKAVQAKDDEEVVFSWFEYPDRAARDAANEKLMTDPRMEEMFATMPFDGKRMIFGGFDSIVEAGSARGGYVDGFVLPVFRGKQDAYREMAERASKIFIEYGATRVIEATQDDVPRGEVTDFYRAVQAEEGETIVFSFIEWPDKQTRDSTWKVAMEDERLKPDGDMPFGGPRMFWGGFTMLLDSVARERADA